MLLNTPRKVYKITRLRKPPLYNIIEPVECFPGVAKECLMKIIHHLGYFLSELSAVNKPFYNLLNQPQENYRLFLCWDDEKDINLELLKRLYQRFKRFANRYGSLFNEDITPIIDGLIQLHGEWPERINPGTLRYISLIDNDFDQIPSQLFNYHQGPTGFDFSDGGLDPIKCLDHSSFGLTWKKLKSENEHQCRQPLYLHFLVDRYQEVLVKHPMVEVMEIDLSLEFSYSNDSWNPRFFSDKEIEQFIREQWIPENTLPRMLMVRRCRSLKRL
jgi:hypothetical protein